MEAHEIEDLTRRLLANPHDESALAYAHQAGSSDPKGYAGLLERVGNESRDPAHAAHWLSQAAEVWSTTLGDAHRAAHLLMAAVKRDPTDRVAADRLASLYREKGDTRALLALLDKRAKSLAPLAAANPTIQGELAGLHEELARLWMEPPAPQPRKAIEHFQRAAEFDPTSAYAIYSARELLKAEGALKEAIPLFQAELALEQDPMRRLALLRDEAETRKAAGDLRGAGTAFLRTIELAPEDPSLRQEFASTVLDRSQNGESVERESCDAAVKFLIGLAEEFGGEHGYAYASGALELEPSNEPALNLLLKLAGPLGKEGEAAARKQAFDEARESRRLAPELAAAEPVKAAVEREPSAPVVVRKSEAPAAVSSNVVPQASFSARVADLGPDEDPLAVFDSEPKRRASAPAGSLSELLETGQKLALKGRKEDAFAQYRALLDADPAHAEALAWVEDYLRSKRDYVQLRDVLLASVRAIGSRESVESKKGRLREVAGLCEGQLRDIDGAVAAWRQLIALDRSDDGARSSLTRILERSQRWDDLANVLEQDAMVEPDVESKIALEKKLARLQEDKRKDLAGAADAWSRIARITSPNESALTAAIKLYERAERLDLAAKLLDECVHELTEPSSKGALQEKLAKMREKLGDTAAAALAYQGAAETLNLPRLWEDAERLFAQSEQWAAAANAATERSSLVTDAKQQAIFLAKAAEYLVKDGNGGGSLAHLERASDLDPSNDALAERFESALVEGRESERLVIAMAKRAERLTDKAKRVTLRKRAAQVASKDLRDGELARDLWLKVLKDGEDVEVLEALVEDAIGNRDNSEAATLLRRLANASPDKADKVRITLREADLLAQGVEDTDTALARYDEILTELDPKCIPALQATARLEEKRGNAKSAVAALDRELALATEESDRVRIALLMARLYESLSDWENAVRVLDIARNADKEDFDTLKRLADHCERTEKWGRVADLLADLVDAEADEEEVAALTLKRAHVLADKLDRNDEALAALTVLADEGHADIRAFYVTLGDRLGQPALVANKLVDWWFDAKHTAERREHLESAFKRFTDAAERPSAIRVGIELVQGKGASTEIAKKLASLALEQKDLEALGVAHDVLAREVSGLDRALLLVDQAHEKVRAGLGLEDAIQHGEEGLAGLPMADALPLVERLAELSTRPADRIDLHERHVGRMKGPADRTAALANAARVAVKCSDASRAKGFYELALTGAPSDETVETLIASASGEDDKTLTEQLVDALAAGGHGARDAGKTRSTLLRKAASLAHRTLKDVERAFALLTESLTTRVDESTMDELEALANSVGDPDRAEAALTQALGEVYDGPLVRQLLRRRAGLRRNSLGDATGATQDLKKLHDLAPHDHSVLEELASAYLDLKDFRGLVQVYEDQFLRSKDAPYRAALALKVAKLWEEQLGDAREAADAWRRVLRLSPGADEAQAGLERAKKNALAKGSEDTSAYLPPPAPPKPEPTVKRPESRRPSGPPATPAPAGHAAPSAPTAPTAPRAPSVPPPPPPAAAARPAPRRETSPTLPEAEEPVHVAPEPAQASSNGSVRPPPAAVLDEEIALSLERLGGGAQIVVPPAPSSEAIELNSGEVLEIDEVAELMEGDDSENLLADSEDVLADQTEEARDVSRDTPPS